MDAVRSGELSQSRTTGQVRVRVTPSTAWIFETTSFPSASMFAASTRTTTFVGPGHDIGRAHTFDRTHGLPHAGGHPHLGLD